MRQGDQPLPQRIGIKRRRLEIQAQDFAAPAQIAALRVAARHHPAGTRGARPPGPTPWHDRNRHRVDAGREPRRQFERIERIERRRSSHPKWVHPRWVHRAHRKTERSLVARINGM